MKPKNYHQKSNTIFYHLRTARSIKMKIVLKKKHAHTKECKISMGIKTYQAVTKPKIPEQKPFMLKIF